MKDLIQRIKENFKQNKLLIIVLFLFWFLVVALTLFNYKESLGKISSGNEAFDNVVELIDGTNVVEDVSVKEDSKAIAIKMATYARRNSGSFNVLVIGNDSKQVYADKDFNIALLQDNAFVVVELNEKLKSNKDKTINITLSSKCNTGNAVGVYYSNLKAYDNSKLKIGNRLMAGDLSFRFLNDSKELKTFYFIVITWVIVTFTLILFLLLLVKPKYEILFFVIALSFGLTFWLIITPMSVPDETIHYEYSFQMSNYMMGHSKDHTVFDEEYQNYGAMAGHMNISAAYERFIKKINNPMSLKNRNSTMNFDIDESYKTCFIPQALGITLGRLLNWNMLRIFYLGRLFNLMFYLICIYIALKKTPVHKLLFGVLATLPIFMQQAASFSYDCYINGLTFVIISILMKWLHEDKKIDKVDFIIAFVANLMIAPIKVVYGLFTLMYWFVPESRFNSKKQRIIGLLIITAPAIYQLLILLTPLAYRVVRKIFEKVFLPARIIAEDFSKALHLEGDMYTFADVTDNPVEMFMMFARTIRYNIKTWFYGSFGRALSGNTLILPTWLVHSLLALLIISAMRHEKTHESLKFKIVTILLCIFGGIMMVGGLLISWTEIDQDIIEAYGGPIIQGVQGRYFSPFLPYLLLVLHNKKFSFPEKIDPYVIYTFVLLVFEVIVYVLSYTFMN